MDNTLQNIDQSVRHEAALLYANNDSRGAISQLLKRINGTNGRCNTKVWLMLLEIYQILGQQEPYEKLAVFFSNRFSFSPPAWNPKDILKTEKGAGQWRNALVVEGSPLQVNEDKRRDFLRAAKEANSSRMDLSRLRLSDDPQTVAQELQKLLDIMQRLRKQKIPTLFMGETELSQMLSNHIDHTVLAREEEIVYWSMMLEILQWRGQEEQHDDLLMRFMNIFNYCPVSFDSAESIAVAPRAANDEISTDGFVPAEIITETAPLFTFMNQQWDKNIPAELEVGHVKRVAADAAREIASFLQANSNEHAPVDIVFLDTNELLTALFETTGVAAYSQIRYRHSKLRDLYNG